MYSFYQICWRCSKTPPNVLSVCSDAAKGALQEEVKKSAGLLLAKDPRIGQPISLLQKRKEKKIIKAGSRLVYLVWR